VNDVLLIGHILLAIVLIGPVSVAASLFPKLVAQDGQGGAARLMHRITRVYGTGSIAVPVIGIVLAISLDVMDTAWVGVSILLSGVVGVLIWLLIADQVRALQSPPGHRRMPIMAGLFNACWLVILVLMVVKPG
jgi:hypothetical protein